MLNERQSGAAQILSILFETSLIKIFRNSNFRAPLAAAGRQVAGRWHRANSESDGRDWGADPVLRGVHHEDTLQVAAREAGQVSDGRL